MNVKIKDIPLLDRPRERLINQGSHNLNNEELLSIILKTGTKESSAKVVSSKLLSQIGGIENLYAVNYETLTQIKGIGNAKACTLLAVIEIAKRMGREMQTIKGIKVNNPNIIHKYYKNIIGHVAQEHFYCLYLDSNKKIIKDKLLFIGTLNQSIVHPREVFKEAYMLSASTIICVHNHPSGNVIPSNEDIYLTKRLTEIGVLMGIKIIDHVIIGYDKYYSFYENNLIK